MFQKTKVEFKRKMEVIDTRKRQKERIVGSGDPGRRVPDHGEKSEATEMGTVEEMPDVVATRRRCCPIKGTGREWGAETLGEVFQNLKWASLPLQLHSNPQILS